jgi:hypothetical protein
MQVNLSNFAKSAEKLGAVRYFLPLYFFFSLFLTKAKIPRCYSPSNNSNAFVGGTIQARAAGVPSVLEDCENPLLQKQTPQISASFRRCRKK